MKVTAEKLLPGREKLLAARGTPKLGYGMEAQPEAEGVGSKLLRGGLRSAARIGESALGLPGDIASGVLGAGSYLTGGAIPNYEELQKELPISLPTSQNVREGVTKQLTGEYLEPQNKVEGFIDNVMGDIVSFMAPGKLLSKAKFLNPKVIKAAQFFLPSEGAGLTSAAKKSFASNFAGMATEELTGSKSLGAGAKMLTILGSNIKGGRASLNKLKDEKYSQVRQILDTEQPRVKATNINAMEQELWKLSENKVIGSKNEKVLKDLAKTLNRSHVADKIPVESAWSVRSSIREMMREGEIPKTLSKQVDKVVDGLTDVLNEYGTTNKAFGDALQGADALTQGLYAQSQITKNLKALGASEVIQSKAARYLLGLGSLKTIPAVAAGIGAAKVAGNASHYFDLVMSNTSVRKYLSEVYKQSFKENKAGTLKAIRNLEKAIKHVENKEIK